MPKGGARRGSGRPAGSGKFGERTTQLRVPVSLVPAISEMLRARAADVARSPASKPRQPRSTIELPPPGGVRVDDPIEALVQLRRLRDEGVQAALVMLDPEYRDRTPSGRAHFMAEMLPLISAAGEIAQHVIVWGLPMAVARLIDHQPEHLIQEAWISWVYKNSPNRARSWWGSQQVALHLRRPDAKLYYQSFMKEKHRELHARGQLPFLMTHRDVIDPIIEVGLLSGSCGLAERVLEFKGGQKPINVLKPIIEMTTLPGDLIVDPTAGSGSTGEAAAKLGRRAILSDRVSAHLRMSTERLAKRL